MSSPQERGIYVHGAKVTQSPTHGGLVPLHGGTLIGTGPVHGGTGVGALPSIGGTSLLVSTQHLDISPWNPLADGVGTGAAPVVTPDAAVAPDGTTTADLISLAARSAVTRRQIMYQQFAATAVVHTGSLYVKAKAAGDIGKQLTLNLWDSVSGVDSFVTLSADWQRVVVTGMLQASLFNNLSIGRADTVVGVDAVEFYAWQGQVLVGSFPYGGDIAVNSI